MKTITKTFAIALTLTAGITGVSQADNKFTKIDINKLLPSEIAASEGPAPQKKSILATQQTYTAAQKAALVELKLNATK